VIACQLGLELKFELSEMIKARYTCAAPTSVSDARDRNGVTETPNFVFLYRITCALSGP
jgi:hypothetical protein